MMQRTGLLIILGVLTATGCAQDTAGPGYDVTVMMLPEGHPDAGRASFISLGCAACHGVAWDNDLPEPTAASPGPELGLEAVQPGPGGLATSIVAPSHKVPAGFKKDGEGEGSPMPDLNRIMTVQQLADVVAYLQKQGLETQARIGQ